MNSAIGTTWSQFYLNGSPPLGSPVDGGWLLGASYNASQTAYLTYGKMSSFIKPGPANTWVIIDENPISINDASFASSAKAAPGATYIIDFASGLHNRAAGMAFADGHSIVHAWVDPRTYTTPPGFVHGQGGQGSTVQSPDNKDCYFLAKYTSALR
jgi:prepilin-type processing-associated H-X9-DG protein